ncbi:FAD-dependent monooxygenase [Luminiphilus sp.]|nr:FAD-dependent monooxygenase [Luminiphilus sp.]
MTDQPHLAIVGGGLAGLLLASRVGERLIGQLRVSLIERRFPKAPQDSLDTRATALSRGSKERLASWGFWLDLEPSAKAINDIHVSRQSRFGSAQLRDDVLQGEPMGWVIENALLQASLLDRCKRAEVDVIEGREVVDFSATGRRPELVLDDARELKADLVIIADGAESALRQSLGIGVHRRAAVQYAIAFNCETDGEDRALAYERFTDEGPLAFLPLPSSGSSKPRYNVIWCAHQDTQARLLRLNDRDFISELQSMIGWRVGKLTKIGQRAGWPLSVVISRETIRHRCILLGNAAHTVHPVAGQGFNLSIRDIHRLDGLIHHEMSCDAPFGSLKRLSSFARDSSSDHEQTISATTLLSQLFDTPSPLIDGFGSAALSLLDMAQPVKRRVAEFGMGRR